MNGYVTWKWLVGALLAAAGAGAGSFAALKSDVAVLQAQVEDHRQDDDYRHTLQDGVNLKNDTRFKTTYQRFESIKDYLHRMELRQVKMEERLRIPKRDRVPIPEEIP